MVRKITLVCDNPRGRPGNCHREAHEYRIWKEGEPRSRRIDLCDTHAADLLRLWDRGEPETLPAKPKRSMKITELKVTEATKSLKKQ